MLEGFKSNRLNDDEPWTSPTNYLLISIRTKAV